MRFILIAHGIKKCQFYWGIVLDKSMLNFLQVRDRQTDHNSTHGLCQNLQNYPFLKLTWVFTDGIIKWFWFLCFCFIHLRIYHICRVFNYSLVNIAIIVNCLYAQFYYGRSILKSWSPPSYVNVKFMQISYFKIN